MENKVFKIAQGNTTTIACVLTRQEGVITLSGDVSNLESTVDLGAMRQLELFAMHDACRELITIDKYELSGRVLRFEFDLEHQRHGLGLYLLRVCYLDERGRATTVEGRMLQLVSPSDLDAYQPQYRLGLNLAPILKGDAPEIKVDPTTKEWIIDGKPTGVRAEGRDGSNAEAMDAMVMRKLTATRAWEYDLTLTGLGTVDAVMRAEQGEYDERKSRGIFNTLRLSGMTSILTRFAHAEQWGADATLAVATRGSHTNHTYIVSVYVGEEQVVTQTHRGTQIQYTYASLDGRQGNVYVLVSVHRADRHWTIYMHALDVYSMERKSREYPSGTWATRPNDPYPGMTYLCTNLTDDGRRILLAWDRHHWTTNQGRIEGDTLDEARASFARLEAGVLDVIAQKLAQRNANTHD